MPSPSIAPTQDADRLHAQDVYARLLADRGRVCDAAVMQGMSDDDLIRALHEIRQVPIPLPSAAAATLEQCLPRAMALGMQAWCQTEGITTHDLYDCKDFLTDEMTMSVHRDGLLTADQWNGPQRAIAQELPIAIYHHTSSRLRRSIVTKGLIVVDPRPGRFNSKAGVYVTTQTASPAAIHYGEAACMRSRGDPITIRITTRLCDLADDPDDRDLTWTHQRQFVLPSVAPADLAWEWGEA
jgi:hypothetical protein